MNFWYLVKIYNWTWQNFETESRVAATSGHILTTEIVFQVSNRTTKTKIFSHGPVYKRTVVRTFYYTLMMHSVAWRIKGAVTNLTLSRVDSTVDGASRGGDGSGGSNPAQLMSIHLHMKVNVWALIHNRTKLEWTFVELRNFYFGALPSV